MGSDGLQIGSANLIQRAQQHCISIVDPPTPVSVIVLPTFLHPFYCTKLFHYPLFLVLLVRLSSVAEQGIL